MTRPRPHNVLFLEPSFLSHRLHKTIRGVDGFGLILARQLAGLGIEVVIPAEGSWRERFEQHFPPGMPSRPRFIYSPSWGIKRPLVNGLIAAARASGGRYGVLYLNNVSTGILPAIRLLRLMRCVDRAVVVPNRIPKARFVRAMRSMPMDALCLNTAIEDEFRRLGGVNGRLLTRYGIPDADRFYPPTESERAARSEPGVVNFVMLGKLDDAWKGADIVRRSFAAMPVRVREQCRLHLLGFARPPGRVEPGVIEHSFLPATSVPGFLREMDVFVGASNEHETFCQAMVQAMLTGLPSVVSSIRVFTEKIDAGAGVAFGSEAELTAAMTRLAEDAEERRRMGGAARRTALARYVWDTGAFVRDHLLPDAAR